MQDQLFRLERRVRHVTFFSVINIVGKKMSFLVTLLFSVSWLSDSKTTIRSFSDDGQSSLETQLRQLEKEYGFDLEMIGPGYKPEKKGWVIQAKPVEGDILTSYLPMFVKEMQLYPRELIQKAKLKRILFCSDLNVNGTDAGGFALQEKDTIYYSLTSERGRIPRDEVLHYYQNAIHHELFHFVDFRVNRNITVDSTWSKLNAPGYRYGSFALNNIAERTSVNTTNRFPGFISRYAQMNVAEDKAETFSRMMINIHEMECRAKDDPILGKKMDRIKQVLQEFSPDMDERFWTRMRNLKRPRLTVKGREDPWADAHPTLPALPRTAEPVIMVKSDIKWLPTEQPCVVIRRRCRCCR